MAPIFDNNSFWRKSNLLTGKVGGGGGRTELYCRRVLVSSLQVRDDGVILPSQLCHADNGVILLLKADRHSIVLTAGEANQDRG